MAPEVPLAALDGLPLLLPSRIHTIRRLVDSAFERAGIAASLVAEIESATTLARTLASAVDSGIGATILPWSSASSIAENLRRAGGRDLVIARIVEPALKARVSICTPDQIAMSDAAQAVHDLILELVETSPIQRRS